MRLLLALTLLGLACQPEPTASAERPAMPDTTAAPVQRTAPRPPLPEGFVYLRDVAPGIRQEIRYATAYNFVGERIEGYEAAECVLTEQAAAALAAVQRDLEREGLGLKVYDCYRPQRAVDHFVRWARSGDDRMKDAFFPTEPQHRLFARGYIARRSGHSRGSTVDLTLVPLRGREADPLPTAPPWPRCDAPRGERLFEGDLDMGTAYDCLSGVAATGSRAVPDEVRRNRLRLRDAMARRGFRNYPQEWWHYTLRHEPFPRTYHDFPIE
ncbi:MAG TPA: M15 family metallopeptidase [Rubricoccaceae bacterium]|nr:M15 family metallopeptidase [Rubricoccaceae bacterium]